jgi:hypothetical protein
MKNIAIAAAFVLAGFTTVYGQQPAPEPDTLRDPVKQIDPEVKQLPDNAHYIDETSRIGIEDLPPAITKTLKGPEYKGWEKSVIYKDKDQDIYTVDIREGGKSRKYRFTKDGQRLKDHPSDEK